MRPWLIAPMLAVAWGLNWPAVKILLATLPPFTMRVLGLGAAALLLAGVARARGLALVPPRAQWPALALAGTLNVAAFNVCTAFAQLNTSTSRAAVLTYSMPMMSALLAVWLLGERLSRRALLALASGSAGLALLAWPAVRAAGAPGSGVSMLGLTMPLAAALAWALGTIATKRWPLHGDRIVHTAWQLAIGAVCAALGVALAHESWPAQWPAVTLVALAYHVVIAMALGYLLWFVLLQRQGAAVAALTTLAVPVVGVLGAMALMGERPSAADWSGFVLVLAGAALILLPQRRGADLSER
ncbi:MAG: DMT family transporter [Burkholderiaceae bacterium]